MIFVVFSIENANAGSLKYTPLLGRERESEPKGRRSNRTAGRWREFAQAITRLPPELARAHQSDL